MTETARVNEDGIIPTVLVYDERSSIVSGQQQLKRYDEERHVCKIDSSHNTNTYKSSSIHSTKEYQEDSSTTKKYPPYGSSIGKFVVVLFCLMFAYVTYLGQSILHELRLHNNNNNSSNNNGYHYERDSVRRDDEVMRKESSRRDSSNKSTVDDGSLKILIVYLDGHEHSMAMAEEVRRGASNSSGSVKGKVQVKVMTTLNATFQDVLECHGLVLGSPVYNANVHPQLQSWINNEWDIRHRLQWKVGGVFVTAGGISAGEESTMLSLQRNLQIFEMIVVGGKTWTSAFGASAITYEPPFGHNNNNNNCFSNKDHGLIHSMFLKKAYQLGQRVADVSYTIQQGQHTSS